MKCWGVLAKRRQAPGGVTTLPSAVTPAQVETVAAGQGACPLWTGPAKPGSDQAAAHGLDRGFGAGGDVQLAIEVLDVTGDGAVGQAQVTGGVGNPESLADADQHFSFPARKFGKEGGVERLFRSHGGPAQLANRRFDLLGAV